ncbi:MAG: prolipoprotein diacylglyceryl transferase [Dietzia sp.]|uniref:prolipoprotein diacylglyceryl transferase n=1 Tax=Dietzia sp. TaxID=1871616 RepID=UPI002728B262|nr:prolipoprotein diacylglyceryl transferase [Dietzia sp.]MDO8394441.1 prolipoprotein diacylglyceryl transferase [Dietzia sp.]
MTAVRFGNAGLFGTITISIDPILARIGHFGLGWYGIAVGAAIATGLVVARREARRRNVDPDAVLRVAAWSIAGGFVGARALFVVDHWSRYASDPLGGLAIQEGGLAIQGALLGGLLAGVVAARQARLPVLVLADIAAPAAVLGQAIGRLGCLVTGDALGSPTSLPWGVSYTNPAAMAPQPGVSFQPVFAYEALWDLAVFALLWRVRTRGWEPGRLFAAYLGLYAAGKFGLTFLRQERVWALGLQEAQFAAGVLLLGALGFWAFSALRGSRAVPAASPAGSGGS